MALCYSGWPAGIWFNYKHTFGSFCVYTVSCENNYCCGWLIGSQSSSEADINGAAVIVTLLVMPQDSPGLRSNNRASPNLENKIPNRLIYLCYKLVLSKPLLKSDHFESSQPGRAGSCGVLINQRAWGDTNMKPICFKPVCHMLGELNIQRHCPFSFLSSSIKTECALVPQSNR